jgi:hypothetical protein
MHRRGFQRGLNGIHVKELKSDRGRQRYSRIHPAHYGLYGIRAQEHRSHSLCRSMPPTNERYLHIPTACCGDKTRFGRGDVQPFLDRMWSQGDAPTYLLGSVK